jgi:hypothetical protein
MEGIKSHGLQFSEKNDLIAAAFVRAQGKMGVATRSSDNPFFRSKYANFGEVSEACKPALHDEGIGVIQSPGIPQDKNMIAVTTMFLHTSGQWMKDTFEIPCLKHDPQAGGSAVSYARRYALEAMSGINCQDDDGEKATRSKPSKKKAATTVDKDRLYGSLATDKADLMKILKDKNVEDPADMIAINRELREKKIKMMDLTKKAVELINERRKAAVSTQADQQSKGAQATGRKASTK